MLTVLNPDGTFAGVQYTEDKQEYRDHHAQYGQTCIWITRAINVPVGEKNNESPSQADLDANTQYETQKTLADLDIKSIRSLRAIASGKGTADDTRTLNDLETQAQALRAKLKK